MGSLLFGENMATRRKSDALQWQENRISKTRYTGCSFTIPGLHGSSMECSAWMIYAARNANKRGEVVQ
jgi:hypothetical protein